MKRTIYSCNKCSTYLVQSGHYIPVEIKINAYQKGNRIIISKYLFSQLIKQNSSCGRKLIDFLISVHFQLYMMCYISCIIYFFQQSNIWFSPIFFQRKLISQISYPFLICERSDFKFWDIYCTSF